MRLLFVSTLLGLCLNACIQKNADCLKLDPTCNPETILLSYSVLKPDQVLLATYAGNFHYSYNGLDWKIPAVPATTNQLNAFAYGKGFYVGVGITGTIVYSTDLENWQLASSPTANNLNDVVYGQGRFVAVGPSDTVIVSSDAKN